ncbi:uncharacterized protein LOC6044653 [Culex quinquefasciatus]|uniref:uncharacterized protein LOC6044653 n=1 Tax=Culex quinquefasciatus TaxID=7176 RepID=UPI0018E36124|nr:uncharacterized protein LOC6044653 [Culex quinquefasciatus]
MYFTCDEMGIALDRFLLSLAGRYAEHSKRLHILSGQAIDEQLKKYVLIVQDSSPELTIVEYRVSIEDFRHVPSREADIDRLVRSFPGEKPHDAELAKRYLILGNESTCDSEANVEIVKGFGVDLTERPPELLALIQAIRLSSELGRANVFELCLNSKTVQQLLLDTHDAGPGETFRNYHPVDPVVKNGMSLMDLYEDIKYKKINLGVFLIRDADKGGALITHVEPIRDLKHLTPTTSFVVSDTISYAELCRLCPLVHEVIYRPDYGLVYWQRSSGGGTGSLRKYLTCEYTQEYDQRPPPLHWLNVIHADQTVGKSTYLRRLREGFRKAQPFGLVRLIDGTVLAAALADGSLSTVQKLAKLFRMESQLESKVVEVLARQKGALMVLIDHADHVGDLLVTFLEEVERDLGTSVKFWIAARDKLRKQIEDKFPIVAHEFPELDKMQQQDFLETLLPELSAAHIEETLKIARTCNVQLAFHETCVEYPITKNVFNLKLIADMLQQVDESKKSFYLPDLLDYFIESQLTEFADLERECYSFCLEKKSALLILQQCKYTTVVEYMAARYLSKHVELVNLTLYREHPKVTGFLDQLISRHDKIATAVLNKDTEQVLTMQDSYQESLDDLNRNPLHTSHDCLAIQEALVAAGLQHEQRCLLSDYTPLQLADERKDWKFVNLLLQNNARHDFPSLRLRTMHTDQLEEVVESCISTALHRLLDWILTNRPDYQITQRNIYSVSVCSDTMQCNLLFRILNRAHEQKLHDREAPYRFMWGSTGLHMAAYNGSFAVCRFLVEKLNFSVDLQDYSGQTALGEASDVEVATYLKSLQKDQREPESDAELEEDVVNSAFIRACNSNNLELVRYCVEQEGHDFMNPERGQYGFINAIAWGNLSIVEYLYEKGFKDQLDIEDSTGCTALVNAVRYEHLPIVKFLVERGADFSKIQDAPNNSELRQYLKDHCRYDPPITFEYLSELGLDELRSLEYNFLTENEDGDVLLHYYIEYHEDVEVLKFLLTQYDNVDLESKFTGRTPLLEAIRANKAQIVDILLAAGADAYKICAKTGQSVLHIAAQQSNKRLLDLFLTKYRIAIDSRDNQGQTIAFYLESNAMNLFRYLIERYGMDVNARNNEGRTVLHEKIIYEGFLHLHEVEYLLREVGVRQNVTDRRGRLALHYAAERGNIDVVQLLERYGGLEWNVWDADGKSPVDLAKEAAQEKLLEYLEQSH